MKAAPVDKKPGLRQKILGEPGQCAWRRKSVRDRYNGSDAYRSGGYGSGESYKKNTFPREDRERPLPRRMRERGAAKKRRQIGLVVLCLLLAANLLLLLELRVEIRGLDRALNQAMKRTDVSIREDEIPQPESGTKEEVANPTYASGGAEPREDIVDYVGLCGLPQVDKPMDRSPEEVLVCLQELSADNELISEIYKEHSLYSDDMLKALVNNPEMADFVKNSLNDHKEFTYSGLSELEKSQDYPLFLQWDPRWGYEPYGDDNIGLSGCGPTCLSMAMYYLLRDESIPIPWQSTAWTMAITSWARAPHGHCWRSFLPPAESAWNSPPFRNRP